MALTADGAINGHFLICVHCRTQPLYGMCQCCPVQFTYKWGSTCVRWERHGSRLKARETCRLRSGWWEFVVLRLAGKLEQRVRRSLYRNYLQVKPTWLRFHSVLKVSNVLHAFAVCCLNIMHPQTIIHGLRHGGGDEVWISTLRLKPPQLSFIHKRNRDPRCEEYLIRFVGPVSIATLPIRACSPSSNT